MIRLLASSVWGGVPKGVYQDYGPTTVPGEPYSYRDKSLFHCGMDIGDLGIGWPLKAARGGVVVSVGWGQLGILVGAETDWYIHVDRSVVSVGQQVARGQLVAYSGGKVPSGGVIYGAHLHFEVQTAPPPTYNRPLTSVDPESVLTGLFSGGSGSLGGDVPNTPQENKALVILAYLAAGDRTPETQAAIDDWASKIHDNGDNTDQIIANLVNSPEFLAHRTKEAAVLAAGAAAVGPKGDKGDPGKDGSPGKDGVSPTLGTIAGPIKVTLS